MKIAYVLRIPPHRDRVRVVFSCGHQTIVATARRERPHAGEAWPCPKCTRSEDGCSLPALFDLDTDGRPHGNLRSLRGTTQRTDAARAHRAALVATLYVTPVTRPD